MILAVFGEALAAALAVAFLAASFAHIEPRAQRVALAFAALAHAALLVARPAGAVVTNTMVLVSAALAGVAVAAAARTPRRLAVFGVAASALAVAAYLAGAGRGLLGGAGELARYFFVSVPVGAGYRPVAGWADLAVLAAFYVALRRAGAGVGLAALPPTAGLVLAHGVGLAHGPALAIPLMTGATLAALPAVPATAETPPGEPA